MLTHEEEAKRRTFHLEHGMMVYARIISAIAFGAISFLEFKNFQLLQGMLLAFCFASFFVDIFSAIKLEKAKKLLDEPDFIHALSKTENANKSMGLVSLSMVLIFAAVVFQLIPYTYLWVAIIAQFSAQAFELFSRTRNLKV